MKLLLALVLFCSFALADTNLLLIGGGPRPVEAMKQFVQLAGSEKADILIIPWASGSVEGAESIRSELATLTKGQLEIVAFDFSEPEKKRLLNRIQAATGIFFTGGDQNQLMKQIKGLGLKNLLKEKFKTGSIFAGTSAGTAIMSDPMLTGKGDLSVLDGSQIELAEGLGLLPPNVIVDQHFIIRSRFNRLAGVILEQADHTGLAIDEGTSLLLRGTQAQVIGPTQVLIFKKTGADKLEVSVLRPGRSTTL